MGNEGKKVMLNFKMRNKFVSFEFSTIKLFIQMLSH
jgi:hypothetical protein